MLEYFLTFPQFYTLRICIISFIPIISLTACTTLIIKKQISPEIKTVAMILDCCKIASRIPLPTLNVMPNAAESYLKILQMRAESTNFAKIHQGSGKAK